MVTCSTWWSQLLPLCIWGVLFSPWTLDTATELWDARVKLRRSFGRTEQNSFFWMILSSYLLGKSRRAAADHSVNERLLSR
jgi:hypothetical protein